MIAFCMLILNLRLKPYADSMLNMVNQIAQVNLVRTTSCSIDQSQHSACARANAWHAQLTPSPSPRQFFFLFVALLLKARTRAQCAATSVYALFPHEHAGGIDVARCVTRARTRLPRRPAQVNLDGEGDATFFTGIVATMSIVPIALPVVLQLYIRFFGGLDARMMMGDNSWE
jgi:hypothetical protein